MLFWDRARLSGSYAIRPLSSKSATLRPGLSAGKSRDIDPDDITPDGADDDTINDFNVGVSQETYVSNQVTGVTSTLNMQPLQNLSALFAAALLNANLKLSGPLSSLTNSIPTNAIDFAGDLANMVAAFQITHTTLELLGLELAALDPPLLFTLVAGEFLLDVALDRARKAAGTGLVTLVDGASTSKSPHKAAKPTRTPAYLRSLR